MKYHESKGIILIPLHTNSFILNNHGGTNANTKNILEYFFLNDDREKDYLKLTYAI